MSKYLCTFSGKFGDILWSLPTAKFISERIVNARVDFATMPYYQTLLPLLVEQSYIENAFVMESWLRTHSNHGDQPWQPPENAEVATTLYESCWHLGYRAHPGISAPSMPLLQFVAYQQGIQLPAEYGTNFIDVSDQPAEEAYKIMFSSGSMEQVIKENRLVTYSFNEQYKEQKQRFQEALWSIGNKEGFEFFNVGEVGWKEAAWLIKKSLVYVGCRSANWVLANGVGKKTITYEPHPSRHKACHLGPVFGNPFGSEFALPFNMSESLAAETTVSLMKKMREEMGVSV